jgi:putative GTP pyrophosphokinase
MSEFDDQRHLYLRYVQIIQRLFVGLLADHGMSVHAIEGRVKSRESLMSKIMRNEGRFQRLKDIDDVAGVRIITYFEDDVHNVADILRQGFSVMETEDKKRSLRPNVFGYLSLHVVVRLPPQLLDDPANAGLGDLKVEVQIRSMLQHAWAEIEHDLGYKTVVQIPDEHRRLFSMLSGLLELADTQFNKLKHDLSTYEMNVQERIGAEPADVSINKSSLVEFVVSNPKVIGLDHKLAALRDAELYYDEAYVARRVDELTALRIVSVAELSDALVRHSTAMISIASWRLRHEDEMVLPKGICLIYLEYALLSESNSKDVILKFLNRFSIGDPAERLKFATKLFADRSSRDK